MKKILIKLSLIIILLFINIFKFMTSNLNLDLKALTKNNSYSVNKDVKKLKAEISDKSNKNCLRYSLKTEKYSHKKTADINLLLKRFYDMKISYDISISHEKSFMKKFTLKISNNSKNILSELIRRNFIVDKIDIVKTSLSEGRCVYIFSGYFYTEDNVFKNYSMNFYDTAKVENKLELIKKEDNLIINLLNEESYYEDALYLEESSDNLSIILEDNTDSMLISRTEDGLSIIKKNNDESINLKFNKNFILNNDIINITLDKAYACKMIIFLEEKNTIKEIEGIKYMNSYFFNISELKYMKIKESYLNIDGSDSDILIKNLETI